MPSNHFILCCPLLLPPSIIPSIRVFSNESVIHIRWPKYWSFSFNISPSHEHSGLIFFRMDWLYLLAVQGTLKSLLQHHSSKASILWCSAFFIFQLSHPYMTPGKTIALTRWTFVGKVISLFFNLILDITNPMDVGLCQLRERTCISSIAGGFFTTEPQGNPLKAMVQFSLSVVSDSLRPHGLHHARPPSLSPTPGAYSNSCPLSW